MRFFLGLALCLFSAFTMAGLCQTKEMYADCGTDDKGVNYCRVKEFVGNEERLCEAPPEYKDKDGNYHFDGESGGRLVLPPSEKQPKNDKPPEEDKQPKNDVAPKGMCYYFGGTYAKSKQEVCSKYGGGWTWGANGCTTSVHKEGFGIMPTLVQCPKGFQEDKQPKDDHPSDGKQPKHDDGKQPKHDEGKQPKGEGQGDSSDGGNGKGSKGEGNGKGEGSDGGSGKGSKGEGNGKGEGSGDAKGKGMFKGGAGSGQLGDVRVPKSRDGMGWKGDFFLRNPNQCPQDKTMNVLGRSMTFSYAKLCGFLDMLSPVIKAVFMFIAGMLVVKSIRAK